VVPRRERTGPATGRGVLRVERPDDHRPGRRRPGVGNTDHRPGGVAHAELPESNRSVGLSTPSPTGAVRQLGGARACPRGSRLSTCTLAVPSSRRRARFRSWVPANLCGMAAKDAVGRYGERVAVDYLTAQGMLLLDRNWRCSAGEIDAILRDGDTLVF